MAENNKNNTTPAENKKAEAKATKSKDKKPNPIVKFFKKAVKFLKDTVGELKKVVWTSKSEVWKSFKLVIAAVVVMSVTIALIDGVSNYVIRFIAGLIG